MRASGVENPPFGPSAATRIPPRSLGSAGIPETVEAESPGLTVGPVGMSQIPRGQTKWMLQWPPFISLVFIFQHDICCGPGCIASPGPIAEASVSKSHQIHSGPSIFLKSFRIGFSCLQLTILIQASGFDQGINILSGTLSV